MKRPTIALFSILLLLALGLAASGPKSVRAGSLGELAFAIQIESTDTADPIVCPMVCCPLADDVAARDEAAADEAAIELNAAETNEAVEVAEDESSYDEYYYEDEYYYGDEYYYEDYGSEYADDYAETDPAADETMELNAPETLEDEHLSDGSWDEYAEDYDYDYTDFGGDYSTEDEAPATTMEFSNCNDGCYGPVALPSVESTANVRSEISDADLIVDAESMCNDACYPFDCYGHQVGDDYASDVEAEEVVDEYDDSYYEDYYYEDYYAEQFDAEATSDEQAEASYDEYEYDYNYEEDYERYYSEEYYDQLEEPTAEAVEENSYEESYEDEYQDYYEDYESDYYDYYYEEYYEEAAEVTEEAAAEDNSDWIDDYTSEYDAIYDDAVYGTAAEPVESARTDVATPPIAEEGCEKDAYLPGVCIDESNSELVDDLPWADELCGDCDQAMSANVNEIDIPADGVTSEYGSDYAEEYYEAYFDWIEVQEDNAPAIELESDEYYDIYFDWLEQQEDVAFADEADVVEMQAACNSSVPATAKTVRKTFDVQAFASYCGSRVAALTNSLAGFGKVIRTAAVDFETYPR